MVWYQLQPQLLSSYNQFVIPNDFTPLWFPQLFFHRPDQPLPGMIPPGSLFPAQCLHLRVRKPGAERKQMNPRLHWRLWTSSPIVWEGCRWSSCPSCKPKPTQNLAALKWSKLQRLVRERLVRRIYSRLEIFLSPHCFLSRDRCTSGTVHLQCLYQCT